MVIKMGESKAYIRTSDEKGSINISHEVVAVIAAAAAVDIDGVYGLYQPLGKEITTVSGRRGLSRGIRTKIEGNNVTVDVYIVAEIDNPITDVGQKVQKVVMSAIEEAIGKEVATVNVHISGVSLKKRNKTA
jgi:uncharacterized alkaline shock family protein YloU